MKCEKCGAGLFQANMVSAHFLSEILLTNKKPGLLEPEKRSTVSCYVCPACGHIELVADEPKKLQID